MNVAFVNENTLGHASYLVPFVNWFKQHRHEEITPHLVNATPLPPALRLKADFTIRGLRRFGLDFHNARWRLTVSQYVREQVELLCRRETIDAVVVNTQSVALDLGSLARTLPVFVCLDATFAQLARTGWFAPNLPSRLFQPLTSAPIRRREVELFKAASRLLPWSANAEHSLIEDCGISPRRIHRLPPSLELPVVSRKPRKTSRLPQLLFMGGHFPRKGGPVLLAAFRKHLVGKCDLHIVTESDVPPEEGVVVHRGIKAGSDAWRERWEQADLFVFPSTLETFGIVLIEALAFQVPVISAEVGAAREALDDGRAGWLLRETSAESLAVVIREALLDPAGANRRGLLGRQRAERDYNLDTNARRLAGWLHACT